MALHYKGVARDQCDLPQPRAEGLGDACLASGTVGGAVHCTLETCSFKHGMSFTRAMCNSLKICQCRRKMQINQFHENTTTFWKVLCLSHLYSGLRVVLRAEETEPFCWAARDSSAFLPPFCKTTRHLQLKYLCF